MCNRKYIRIVTAILLSTALCLPLRADDDKDAKKDEAAKGGDKKPSDAEMMAMMMEMAKPGEQHKRMQERVGSWSYVTKYWMSPEAPPNESTGSAVIRSVMDGRYFISEHSGKMQMPGPDGKMMDMEFKGMGIEGYDNAKKKIVSSWIDNMGTGIMSSEGTYDSATKTVTAYAEYEMAPGMKTKMRMVSKTIDKDHNTLEFFEDRGGKEVKTMEISYTRKS
jgi:uncharacterized protein DUF1579